MNANEKGAKRERDPKSLNDLKKQVLKGITQVESFNRISSSGVHESLLAGLEHAIISKNDAVASVDALHLAALARTGGAFKGGMSAYREFLIRIAKRFGAHVVEGEASRFFF